jgi:hypothetical protein
MKRVLKIAALTGLMGLSAQVMADDSSATPPNKDQLMQQCMDKQKAANSGMTQTAMETVCKNEINKKTKNGNDLATGTQAPKPQN